MAEQIKNLIAKWDATWPSPLVVSRQHDNGQFRINLVDYPEPENYENQNEEILETINYYLVVWMKQSEDGEMEKLAPIQLPGPYWLVNSPYTQLVQDIKFQFYATSSVTGYIAHSAQFKGMILESLSGSQQQSVIPDEMWDAYKQYIEDKIIGAGLATIDPTLSISGAAADAKATGDAIAGVNGRLQLVSTLTKNIVSVESGRRYVNSSGVIAESVTNWYGMIDKVPCEPNTAYVCSFHNIEYDAFNPYVAEYDSNGTFIKRSESSRVTTTEDTAYIYACTYCSSGITVNDGAATQIEEGTTATEYVPHVTANDWVARATTEGISVEASRNILLPSLEKSVGNATYTADGNGYKVVATSTSTSRLRFKLFANVTAGDVGRTFTLSALLSELSASATRIAFVSGNTVRKSLGMSLAGERYSLSYTITSADVDRILWASVYSNDTPTATGNYSVWHDIQVEESAFPTPYADPTQKTVIDYTARALTDVLMDKAEAQYNALSVKYRTLDSNVAYILTTPNPCVNILRCRASYTGTSAPTITFSTGLYTSPAFVIGGTEPKMQSWRIPPDLTGGGITVSITVPSGTTLNIEYLYSEESAFNPTNTASKPRFNSHLGFRQMCPENTLPAVEMAGILGYSACIVVPKATADGVLVCIHDDTINATARDENGSAPGTTMNVSDMTYAELMEWDFGKYKNAYWTGAKILTVDDFFAVCARYGMAPMFSTHPALTTAQWQTVRALLIKHGLLSKMHVKAFDLSTIEGAYTVLGQDIDGYTGEHGDSYVSIAQLQTFVSSHSIDTKKCRVVSEKSKNTITESYVSDVLAAGLECGCYTITSTESAATIKQMLSWGVTEFTDDTYCQVGMNW